MPFTIIRDEIARQSADAVIVPANPSLTIDGGAGLAVGRVAGISKLQAACYAIGSCEVGCAVATYAFDFPAKHIIHAVGPTWDGSDEARRLLEQTYASALAAAIKYGAQSIALPLISSGARGCPTDESLHVALAQVKLLLDENPEVEIRIVLFEAKATDAGKRLYPGLQQFIDDTYVDEHAEIYDGERSQVFGDSREAEQASWGMSYGSSLDAPSKSCGYQASAPAYTHPNNAPAVMGAMPRKKKSVFQRLATKRSSRREQREADERQRAADQALNRERQDVSEEQPVAAQDATWEQQGADKGQLVSACMAPAVEDLAEPRGLDEILDSIDAPFSTTLLAIIDERGFEDAEVYKRANLSRQHFSKIRSNPTYQPTKRTVLALAVALELSLTETEDLLRRAGLALSPASQADLIVKWFIMREDYDIFAINEALYAYDQPILG